MFYKLERKIGLVKTFLITFPSSFLDILKKASLSLEVDVFFLFEYILLVIKHNVRSCLLSLIAVCCYRAIL